MEKILVCQIKSESVNEKGGALYILIHKAVCPIIVKLRGFSPKLRTPKTKIRGIQSALKRDYKLTTLRGI